MTAVAIRHKHDQTSVIDPPGGRVMRVRWEPLVRAPEPPSTATPVMPDVDFTLHSALRSVRQQPLGFQRNNHAQRTNEQPGVSERDVHLFKRHHLGPSDGR